MPAGAIVGLAAFVGLSLALGVRLFGLARRSGGLPEYALAVAFFFSGGIGAALQAVKPLGLGSPELQSAAWVCVRASIDLGIGCQVLFTWRVFRPRSPGAAAAFVAFAGAAAAILAGYTAAGALGDPLYRGRWFWIEAALHLLALGWASIEPLRYHARMQRRLRLGLADPVVANRFLVWGIAVAAACGAVAVPAAFEALGLANETGLLAGITAAFALVSALGYALTFFPPHSYRRFLARRVEAQRGLEVCGGGEA
jgi:hypothetical protein